MSVITEVAPQHWQSACSALLDQKMRFLGLYASHAEGALALRAMFHEQAEPVALVPGERRDGDGERCRVRPFAEVLCEPDSGYRPGCSSSPFRVLTCSSAEGSFGSIVHRVPAAVWDEREAHDLYGVELKGHEPMRALVAHPAALNDWTVPVTGQGTNQVVVGPIHAGVIESGHFRFHAVGERILNLDIRLFYKHRGLERAAQGASLERAIKIIQRACATDAVSNSLAYAQACEELLGLWPTKALALQRTLLVELERLYSHLNDIGAICAGIGFAPGAMAFSSMKERALRVNHALSGHRYLFDTIAVGHATRLASEKAEAAAEELEALRSDAMRAWREVLFNASVQNRLKGTGTLPRKIAQRLGAVGPAARGSGLKLDARTFSARLCYEGFVPLLPEDPTGDVASRMAVRAAELPATFDMLKELLEHVAHRPALLAGTEETAPCSPIGVGVVEGPRGQSVCAVESDGETIERVHLRSGSYANWPSLAYCTAGNLLGDFPLINKSFELCYACVDR